MFDQANRYTASAYGGTGWLPRQQSLRGELGRLWAACGINSEYETLRAVVLHRPGSELTASYDANAVNMLEPLDLGRAQSQHDALAAAYRTAGATVYYTEPLDLPKPNQMFMADLFWMTPEGAIIARPASEIRAGEERLAMQTLAKIGVPIVCSIGGRGTFEGADAIWLDTTTALLGRGLRTNDEGAAQVAAALQHMGVRVAQVDLPFGTMHLMGMLRIIDQDLAFVWPTRLAVRAVEALRELGYHVHFAADLDEAQRGAAFNLVTLGPRQVLLPAGNPNTERQLRELGVECVTVEVDELTKAAGAIGCLTGVLWRG
jgi:N-dimethylarginine dimethylaminohydrolase